MMNPARWVHLRELGRLTASAPGTLKKEVDALVQAGLLITRQVGNQTQFCANVSHPVFNELAALIKKTIGLADVLTQALLPLSPQIHAAFVFGSVARSTDNDQSDVDVMLLGDVSFGQAVHALYDAQKTIGREINPKVMAVKEWQAQLASAAPFVTEVLRQPKLFLIGSERELQLPE